MFLPLVKGAVLVTAMTEMPSVRLGEASYGGRDGCTKEVILTESKVRGIISTVD